MNDCCNGSVTGRNEGVHENNSSGRQRSDARGTDVSGNSGTHEKAKAVYGQDVRRGCREVVKRHDERPAHRPEKNCEHPQALTLDDRSKFVNFLCVYTKKKKFM
mgnify:FL=1